MIFISGGGNYQQSAMLDGLFFRRCKKILYIPVGLKRNFSGYEGCWEWFCKVCCEHGFCIENVDMQLYLNDIEDLERYDGIYIGGASDIKWLYDVLDKSGFARKLHSYVLYGGNIYGGSAGGVILGQSLDLQGECGLKILPFSILPHYSGDDLAICSYFKSNSFPLVVLKEDGGIVYENNMIKSVGYSPTQVYFTETNFTTLENNCLVNISYD